METAKPNGLHNEDSETESSVSDILDKRNEEGWEDVEPDTEDVTFISLFDNRSFSDAREMLLHCKTDYNFDIWKIKENLELGFIDLIQLVNYVRSEVKRGNTHPDVTRRSYFEDERYMKPVLEDDALLFSLDDVFDDQTDSIDARVTSEVETLRHELATLNAQFAAYREEVQRNLMSQVENDDEAAGTSTKRSSRYAKSSDTNTEKDKSVDDGYFESYSYNSIHETMLKDRIRTDAYRDFIYENKHLFKDKIVLDVGCGTGILSMFCAKAGAKLVIAVDNSAIIEKTRENVFTNGLQDTIKCVRGKIEEVSMPVPKVDIIVSEWMGYCLLYESMLDSVIYARDKYLTPEGLMVPSHATIRIAPLADSDLKASHIDFWHDVYGFNMTPMLEKAHEEVLIRVVDKTELAGDAVTVVELDLHGTSVADLSFSKPFSLVWKQDYHFLEGFVVWFDIFFATSSKPDELKGLLDLREAKKKMVHFFSTGPRSEPTHWQQGVLLIKDTKGGFEQGQKLTGQLTYRKKTENDRSLDIDITWKNTSRPECSQTWLVI